MDFHSFDKNWVKTAIRIGILHVCKNVIIPAFFFRKKGYINFVSKSVRSPSVRPSVRPCVRPSVTFLVNVSPPKPLEVATSNFVDE